MQIWKDNGSQSLHWLACEETGKIISINAAGARKVAKVCSVDIKSFTYSELDNIKALFKNTFPVKL